MALYVKLSSSCEKTWTGFTNKSLHNILDFLKISIPSALMLCLNTFGIAWMIPFGLSAAVSTRVSNELGAGHPQAASLAVPVVLILAITEGIILVLVMILLRKIWGNLYSSETQVIKHVVGMMPILATSSFLDGIQSVLSGIILHCSREWMAEDRCMGESWILLSCWSSFCNCISFCFAHERKGLWLGIVFAFIVQAILFAIITMRTNWKKEADKAARRVQNTKIPLELPPQDPVLPS